MTMLNGDWRSQSHLLKHRAHRFDALHDILAGQGMKQEQTGPRLRAARKLRLFFRERWRFARAVFGRGGREGNR